MSMVQPEDELTYRQMLERQQRDITAAYDAGYRQSEMEESEALAASAPPQSTGSKVQIEVLGLKLMDEFHEAESAREMVNLRWLDDLRQYRGIYSDAVQSKMCKGYGSQAFYRLTTAKVNTMTARLVDLMFPQKSKNWEIEPTPAPDLPQDILADELKDEIAALTEQLAQAKIQELSNSGVMPDDGTLQQIMQMSAIEALQQIDTDENRNRVAKARAKRMEEKIDDQLKEYRVNGQLRPAWRQSCKRVIKSACMYGMGILKGPLIEQVTIKRYRSQAQPDGTSAWAEEEVCSEYRPYQEAVSVWDVFPDPGARVPAELRYVWQRHRMTDKEVKDLLHIPGFKRERIETYLRTHEDGDAEFASWETQVRDLNSDNATGATMALKNRFLLFERWGYLSGKDLHDAGIDIQEERYTDVFPSCVWLIGDTVIKASVNPLDGVDIPYHFYPYQEDESSFWPEGVCYQLRTPQACINAAVRATQDNANLSSGPIFGINVADLSAEEDLRDMRAGKIFLFDRPGVNLNQMFQAVTVPSAIEHNLGLVNFWSNVADEVSTPRFNQGDGSIKGAGETASGLSMLMGASNILLKDHVKDFDDCIVSPFIRAMFRWNMQWNPDERIKGDYEVVASGSQSLIAKEVRAQQIPVLISYLQMPQFEPYLEPRALLEVAMEQTDLPSERVLRTEEEAKQHIHEQMVEQAQAQAEAEVQALMGQLEKMGMPHEMVQQQLMQILAQTVAQGPQLSSAVPGPAVGSDSGPSPLSTGDIPVAPPQSDMAAIRQLPVKGPENVL